MIARLAFAFSLGAFSLAALPAAAAPDPIRVILVGDSTLQAGTGYGAALCARFSPEVTCLNRGRGGRSSKSYRVEGIWDETMAIAKDGAFKRTYILIQLGHNDGSSIPARHTELPEYKANMAAFIDDARAAGAKPVLITLVTDRRFKDGVVQKGMKPWADLTAEVAREKTVPLIDLYNISVETVQKMGATGAAYLAPAPPPANVLEAALTGNTPGRPTPPTPASPAPAVTPAPAADAATPATPAAPRPPGFDYVHIGPTGAPLFAGIVVDELKVQVPELAPYIVPAS